MAGAKERRAGGPWWVSWFGWKARIAVALIVALCVGLIVQRARSGAPDPAAATVAGVHFAPTSAMLAQASLASPEVDGALSAAYALDSTSILDDAKADVEGVQSGGELPIGTFTAPAWNVGGEVTAVDGRESTPYFTATTPDGAALGRLDTTTAHVQGWRLPAGASTSAVAVRDGRAYYLADSPPRLHEFDPGTGVDRSWDVGGGDTAASQPMVVWHMHDGRVLHPRIGADGDVYFSTEAVLGRLDPRTGAVTTWASPIPIDNFNGIALSSQGLLYANAGAYLIRLDPRTGAATLWCEGGRESDQPDCRDSGLTSGATHDMALGDEVVIAGGRDLIVADSGKPGDFVQWDLGSGDAVDLGADAQGRIWFTDDQNNQVGRLDMASGTVTRWTVPSKDASPNGIHVDGSGVYFTESKANKVARLDPRSGQVTEWSVPKDSDGPVHIKRGRNGWLYFTLSGSQQVGAIDPTSGGRSSTVHPSSSRATRAALDIAATAQQLTITPSTYTAERSEQPAAFTGSGGQGVLSVEQTISNVCCPRPHDLTPDGGYVAIGADSNNGAIAYIAALDTRTARPIAAASRGVAFATGDGVGLLDAQGAARTWHVAMPPGRAGGVSAVAVGNDGTLWYAAGSEVGSIATDGTARRWTAAAAPAEITALAASADGRVWYATAGGAGVLDPAHGTVATLQPPAGTTVAPVAVDVTAEATGFLDGADGSVVVLPSGDRILGDPHPVPTADPGASPGPAAARTPATTKLAATPMSASRSDTQFTLTASRFMRLTPQAGRNMTALSGDFGVAAGLIVAVPMGAGTATGVPGGGSASRPSDTSRFSTDVDRAASAYDTLVRQAAAGGDRSVEQSWNAFEQATHFQLASAPSPQQTVPVPGSSEAGTLHLLLYSELVRGAGFGASGLGDLQSVAKQLGPAGTALVDASSPPTDGTRLILSALLPAALPDLESLAGTPAGTQLSDAASAALRDLFGLSAQRTGQARAWAAQDAAFEFLLDLQRLGPGAAPGEAVDHVATAAALARSHVQASPSPPPPGVAVRAYVAQQMAVAGGDIGEAALVLPTGARQVVAAMAGWSQQETSALQADRDTILAAVPAEQRATAAAQIDATAGAAKNLVSSARQLEQSLAQAQKALQDQAAQGPASSSLPGVLDVRATSIRAQFVKDGSDTFSKVFGPLITVLAGGGTPAATAQWVRGPATLGPLITYLSSGSRASRAAGYVLSTRLFQGFTGGLQRMWEVLQSTKTLPPTAAAAAAANESLVALAGKYALVVLGRLANAGAAGSALDGIISSLWGGKTGATAANIAGWICTVLCFLASFARVAALLGFVGFFIQVACMFLTAWYYLSKIYNWLK